MRRRMLPALLACAAAFVAPSHVEAQAMVRPDSAVLAAMRRLEWLVGDWRGEAWVQMGQQGRATSRVTESAKWRLEGAGLLIEGRGTAQVEPGGPEVTVHDALAVVTYDREAGRYRFTAWRGDGTPVDATAEVGDRRLVWGFRDPRGVTVRFTLRLTPEGRWNEVGEASRDGQTWFKFMEMNLERVSATR
jgi:hypothetical protein